MAMINCPECGKEVSSEAANCPNCGHALQTPKKKSSAMKTVLIVLLVIFLAPIALMGGCVAVGAVVGLVSPSSQTSSSSQANELKVGTAFTADDIEYTITEVGYGTQLGEGYLYIQYTGTNNSDEARTIFLNGKLYDPDGQELNDVYVTSLKDFNTTNGSGVLPGASDGGLKGFKTSRQSGEYTFIVDESNFDGELKFNAEFPDDGTSEPTITFSEE